MPSSIWAFYVGLVVNGLAHAALSNSNARRSLIRSTAPRTPPHSDTRTQSWLGSLMRRKLKTSMSVSSDGQYRASQSPSGLGSLMRVKRKTSMLVSTDGQSFSTQSDANVSRAAPGAMATVKAATSNYEFDFLGTGYGRTQIGGHHCWLNMEMSPLTNDNCKHECNLDNACLGYTFDASMTHGSGCYLYTHTRCTSEIRIHGEPTRASTNFTSAGSASLGPWTATGSEAISQTSGSPTSAKTYIQDALVMAFSGTGQSSYRHSTYEKKEHIPKEYAVDWLKPLRCNSTIGCEECTPEDGDCPFTVSHEDDGTDSQWQLTAVSGNYKYYLVKVHVVCPTARQGHINVRVEKGKVDTFVDDFELNFGQTTSSGKPVRRQFGHFVHFVFDMASGAHEIEIKLKPNNPQEQNAEFIIKDFNLLAKPDFVRCTEGTYCLANMSGNDPSAPVYSLLANNSRQLACLNGAITGDEICDDWITCLQQTGQSIYELRVLLQAALHSPNRASSLLVNRAPSSEASEENRCSNPKNENPEEWACDCFQNWLSQPQCSTASTPEQTSACLQQVWCERYNETLCEDWKTEHCVGTSSMLSQIVFQRSQSEPADTIYDTQMLKASSPQGSKSSGSKSSASLSDRSLLIARQKRGLEYRAPMHKGKELDGVVGTKQCS